MSTTNTNTTFAYRGKNVIAISSINQFTRTSFAKALAHFTIILSKGITAKGGH
jgi:hypothetical protein